VLRRLQSLGLLAVVNPERPRLEQAFEAPALVWDALRGERHAGLAAWCGYRPPSDLAALDELVLPAEPRALLAALPGLVQGGEVQTLVVRGPSHNGRRTALGAAARQLGRGLLVVDGAALDDERWRLIGPLATLLEAVPVLALALDPGQSAALPALDGYDGLLGVVMGQVGGLRGPRAERALTMTLEMPAAEARRELWQRSLQMPAAPGHLEATAERMRLTSGHIQRAASLACTYAALGSRPAVTLADVRQGSRALNRQALETLAQQVETGGDWSRLAVGAETRRELLSLESRCRHRERLHASVNPLLAAQMNCGVRALFSGPSGTGKTLAARLLASVLEMDLYRLDLAAVVNKYIGETEKNLSQVFARAEELDVILLLDEGDALLTQRTAVNTSNDRYANLETNYLLQRIESYQGILLITTNAGDRIDSAFQRRMDVVVDFRLPEIDERRAIWQSHLPADLAVDRALLDEIVHRCALSGGQIRNAVLHASLLALGNGGVMAGEHLEAALQREYRKTGGVCPLRPVHSNGNGRGR
jgi:hypothetical protein